MEEDTLHLTGVDMVDGTPVLDIKPYIPQYDSPQTADREECSSVPPVPPAASVDCPSWIGDQSDKLRVIFSNRAEADLANIDMSRCQWLRSERELRQAILDILSSDPRSVYRKNKCSDRMYFTSLDGIHVTAWFDPDLEGMEVLRVKPQDNNTAANS